VGIKKTSQTLLSIVSLSFIDKDIEQDFLKYYRNKIVGPIRYVLVISLMLYIAFAILDSFLFPELAVIFHKIRFFVIIPLVILTLSYTFFSSSLKYLQLIASISVLVAGFGILAMLYIGGREVNILYYVGLTLVFIYNYDFIKLRFLNASIVGNLILLGYVYVALKIDESPQVLVTSLFFLISANIMGMVSAYYYESINRKYFYSNILLEKEKQKTAEINLNLEEQVIERTANLERANKELTIAKDKAEESERMKSVFLATMSHELRTPLNAIIGFSQLIELEDSDPDENIENAQIIRKSGLHLLSLVESLFDITLIDSGEIKVILKEFLLLDMLVNVNSVMQHEKVKQGNKAIQLIFDPAPIRSDFKISTDEYKIKQILINLLNNALKFTESGEIRFWCEEIKEYGKSYLKFYVSDTGIGIPKDKIEFVFDVFRQVDETHSRKYGGVGIGLNVVRKLAHLLGGDVGVESFEGKGSTFYFTISNYAVDGAPDANSEKSTFELAKLTEKKILVVEDDHPSYSLLKAVLRKWGYIVAWAQNGEIALKILEEKQKFDLILMDINMPVLNGYDATAQIKKQYPENIIIAQTAYAVSGDKEKALLAGCDDYITKPISVKKLKALIECYI
jgi:signal transduction histidine kinase